MRSAHPHPTAADIAEAAALLRRGGLVAFPTETVYGLGADAANAAAVARVFAAKGRPSHHPLIVHIADAGQLEHWAAAIPDQARRLAARFWPGPMALVLPKRHWVPAAVTGGQPTVALRVPAHPLALDLLQAFGGGIAAPSANRFCRISPTQAAHVRDELGDAVDMVLDGGQCRVGIESTIIDLSGGRPRLLRPGQLSAEAVAAELGEALAPPAGHPQGLRAPGMMALHYAPATAVMACASAHIATRAADAVAAQKRPGVLAYGPQGLGLAAQGMVVKAMPDDADAYAQALYAALRFMDGLGLDLIIVEWPPEGGQWQGVRDRLRKATGLG